jgi:Ca2+-binding EF-hand superfamily protein
MPEQPWDGFYSPPGTVDILAEAANDPYKKAAVELFQEIDTDVSGHIDLEEFLALEKRLHSMTLPAARWELTPAHTKKEALRKEAEDTTLGKAEKEALGKRVSVMEFQDVDTNQDGKVSLKEWLYYIDTTIFIHGDVEDPDADLKPASLRKEEKQEYLYAALRRSLTTRRASVFKAEFTPS